MIVCRSVRLNFQGGGHCIGSSTGMCHPQDPPFKSISSSSSAPDTPSIFFGEKNQAFPSSIRDDFI